MIAVLSAIIPVFLVAVSGALLRRVVELDVKTLSALNVYLLIPALVFSSLSKQPIEWSLFGKYALAVALAYTVSLSLLGLIAWLRGIGGSARSALLMTAFPNLGNFGLPVARFAFGEAGLALAVIVMVCGSLLQNTLGLYYAQRGRHSTARAFRNVFLFPILYAFALALLFQRMEWTVIAPLRNAIDLVGEAAIPIQLLVLGIKLAETRLDCGRDVWLASAVRLVAGPLAAFALTPVIGLEGLNRAVYVVMMSGPVAVGMAAFGVQFDVHPRFLASVVSWTFFLSLFTVSLLLYWFLAGL